MRWVCGIGKTYLIASSPWSTGRDWRRRLRIWVAFGIHPARLGHFLSCPSDQPGRGTATFEKRHGRLRRRFECFAIHCRERPILHRAIALLNPEEVFDRCLSAGLLPEGVEDRIELGLRGLDDIDALRCVDTGRLRYRRDLVVESLGDDRRQGSEHFERAVAERRAEV